MTKVKGGTRRAMFEQKAKATEHRAASALDDLSAYEEFKKDLLPKLRQAIQQGKKPEEVMKLVEAIAAARIATIAAFSTDEKNALTASRDLLDRTIGKAKETKTIKHAMEDAKEEDLDAVLIASAAELGDEGEG